MKFVTKGGICCISQVFNWHFYFDPFNDRGEGREFNKFVSVLGEDGTKIAPTGSTGDIFDPL